MEFIILDNKPTISVLVSDFDQLSTLFDDQLSFCMQFVIISPTTSTLIDLRQYNVLQQI